jgi:hypothetical protein
VSLIIFCCFAFLAACLGLGTTPLRTTSFVGLPLLVVTGLLLSRVLRWELTRIAGAVLLLGLTLWQAPALIGGFQFVPYENWLDTHRLITASLPPPAVIHTNDEGDGLPYYFDPESGYIMAPPMEAGPSRAEFESGRYAVVTGRWTRDEEAAASPRFQGHEVSPRGFEIQIVGRFRHIYLNLAVPPETLVAARNVISSPNLQGGQALDIVPAQRAAGLLPLHSLNFLLSDNGCWPGAEPVILIKTADAPDAPPETVTGIQAGRLVVFPLENRRVQRVLLPAAPGLEPCLSPENLQHIWFQPGR